MNTPIELDWARQHIGTAFECINALPHGDGMQAERLASAQEHLAAARRLLDAWALGPKETAR